MTSNSSKEFSIMGFFKTFALGAGLTLGLAATADAETLRIQIFDGATLLAQNTSLTGSLTRTVSSANFSDVTVSVQGVPILPTPNLSSTAISATTGAVTGPVTLTIKVTQVGLNAPSAVNLDSTFNGNTLTSKGNYSTFTVANYIDANNSFFGTTTPIGAANYSGNGIGSFSTPPVGYAAPADTSWSETMIYTITFTGANSSISASSQIVGVATVPEPMTIALLGAGLLGLAAARRRKAA